MSLKEKFSAAKKGAKKGLTKAFNSRSYSAAWIAVDLACFGILASAAVTTGGLALPIIWGVGAVVSAYNTVKDTKRLKQVHALKKQQKRSAGPQ